MGSQMAVPFNSSVFVLCAPACKHASLATPVFIEFKAPLVLGSNPWNREARLRSLSSFVLGSEPEWQPAEDLLPEGDLTFDALPPSLANDIDEMLALARSDLAMCALVREMAEREEGWEAFRESVEQERFTANVWFERDRKNVNLTDGLTSRVLVCLWDGDVDDAIESGYLTPPGVPRARDSDWLEPLLQYANETGALAGLATRPSTKEMHDHPRA